MRIGELSKRSGLSRGAIRVYERSGILRAETREGSNNYKSYPEDALITLEVVQDAQAAGVSLGDIAMLVSQMHAEYSEDFDGDAFLAQKIDEIEARIAASTRFLEMLKQTRDALRRAPLPD